MWGERKCSALNWEETDENEKYLNPAPEVKVHQSGILSPLGQPQQGIDPKQTVQQMWNMYPWEGKG